MSTTAAEVSQHSQVQHSSFGCGFVPLFQLTSAPAAGRWALRGTLRSPSCQVRGRAGSMAKEQPEKQLVLHISHCWAGGSSPRVPFLHASQESRRVPSAVERQHCCSPQAVEPSGMFYIRAFFKLSFWFCVWFWFVGGLCFS